MKIGLTRSEFIRAIKGKIRIRSEVGKQGIVIGIKDDGTTIRIAEIEVKKDGVIKLLTSMGNNWFRYSKYIIQTIGGK